MPRGQEYQEFTGRGNSLGLVINGKFKEKVLDGKRQEARVGLNSRTQRWGEDSSHAERKKKKETNERYANMIMQDI